MSATARPRSSRVTRACDHSLLATGVEQVEKTAMSSEYTVDAIWPIMALFGLEEELVDLRASKDAEELVSDMAVPVVVEPIIIYKDKNFKISTDFLAQ